MIKSNDDESKLLAKNIISNTRFSNKQIVYLEHHYFYVADDRFGVENITFNYKQKQYSV